MAGSAVTPALPALRRAFAHHSAIDVYVALIPGASAFGTMLGALFIARPIKRWGPEPVLAASLLGVAGAGTIGGWLHHLSLLLFSRLVLGVAVAGTMTATTTWIGDRLQGSQQDQVTGRHGVAMEVAGVVFFTLAGLLATRGWRPPFALYLFALPVGLIVLGMPRPRPRRTYALRGRTRPGAAVALKNLGAPLIGAGLGMFAMSVWTIELPFFLTQTLNGTSVHTGAMLATATAGAAVSGLLFPRLKARYSFQSLLVASMGGMSVAMLIMPWARSLALLTVVMFGAGLGFGQIMPVAIGSVNANVSDQHRSQGQAWLTSAAFGGQVAAGLTTALLGPLGGHGRPAIFVGVGILGLALSISLRPHASPGPMLPASSTSNTKAIS